MGIESKQRRNTSPDEPREDSEANSEPLGRTGASHKIGEQDTRTEDSTGAEKDGNGEQPGSVWGLIWRDFAANRKRSSSGAWSKLQLAMAANADKIVPVQLNGKDFTSMMSEVEERIKNDMGSGNADPAEALAKWLQGDTKEVLQ